ncbi:MAG: efflux RND transporter periplasmic adaptor subunit [Gammaproteobacteria bacterium]|nr:efflux RND transporter periplasmic adaptor subunit [Gammaproteobacteria bacterium]
MVRPIAIVVIVAVVILGGIFGWQVFMGRMMGKFMAAAASAPQTVSTYVARTLSWQSEARAVGNVRALHGADLAAQIAGVVDAIDFKSGERVRAGATLMRLRLNDDPAKLAQLQAQAKLAALTLARDRKQFAVQAVSQATLDADAANLGVARAAVAAQQALIAEKIVRAPFSGRLGIRLVDPGQYLAAGAPVVTLQATDPILVDFYLPQQTLAAIREGQQVTAAVDTYHGALFEGRIVAINSKVDAASRNVLVRASFQNHDGRLVPGMYANVTIHEGAPRSYVTVPETAITYNPYGATVFVVTKAGVDAKGKAKLIANQRFVKLGPTRGNQVAVLDGLAAGEIVVSAGQIKLHNGSPVAVDNSVVPSDSATPTPPNE